MNLGSIAHLQYYFARTGLLDGKGAQMAKGSRKKGERPVPLLMVNAGEGVLGEDGEYAASPDELVAPDGDDAWEDPVMLPPTVSTYSQPTHHIEPPPNMRGLKRDLREALQNAREALEAAEQPVGTPLKKKRVISGLAGNYSMLAEPSLTPEDTEADNSSSEHLTTEPKGWHEVQGVYILDYVTLAIRAARIYYNSHENPTRLAQIKSERKIRQELLAVLDILKKWAGRNFSGGLKSDEHASLLSWIESISTMLDEESKLEEAEAQERAGWTWISDSSWNGNEYARSHAFLSSFLISNEQLPEWTPPTPDTVYPTPFLSYFRDGRNLVNLHNALISKSLRHFGSISSYHTDVSKPYRCADNLRYWIKAAEIRWDIKLEVDVMGVVYDASREAWRGFENAISKWSIGVREELVRDWNGESVWARRGSVGVVYTGNGGANGSGAPAGMI